MPHNQTVTYYGFTPFGELAGQVYDAVTRYRFLRSRIARLDNDMGWTVQIKMDMANADCVKVHAIMARMCPADTSHFLPRGGDVARET